jgi:hypothetical protein
MIRLEAAVLAAPRVAHGFFGRRGGVSTGIFASLNCGPGSGDFREHVIANRSRALSALSDAPEARLLTAYQIHSANAVVVAEPWNIGEGPRADAMATNRPGLALGILTADCAPVLLADPEAGVIGAAHAGWKGAHGGVIDSVLVAMEQLGADRARIAAAIGPCISQANYQVGPEFLAAFRDADPHNLKYFTEDKQSDRWHFDLPGYVAARLVSAGIGKVEAVAPCTYASEEDFFSFRRATHRGEPDYGRQLSAVLLRP